MHPDGPRGRERGGRPPRHPTARQPARAARRLARRERALVRLALAPVADEGGGTIVGIARIIDAERAALERMRLLADVSAALDASLDMDRTLAAVAELWVRDLADWCSIDMADDDRELRNVAVAHVDPAKVELARRMRERYPPDPRERRRDGPRGPHRRAAAARRVSDEQVVAGASDAEHLELLRSLDLSSLLIVPLRAREHVLGAITLARTGRRPGYTEDDVAFVEQVAARAALALDNARLYGEAREQERASGEARALLDALVSAAPIGQGFLDTDFRYIRVNDALAEINGVPAIDHLGRSVREVLPALATEIEAALTQVLATGEAIVDLQLLGETPREPGRARHYVASYYPVALPRGERLGHRPHGRRRHRSRRGGAGSARAARPLRGAHARAERARPGLRAARGRARGLRQRGRRGPDRAQRRGALRAALGPRRHADRRAPGGRCAAGGRARRARAGRAVSHRDPAPRRHTGPDRGGGPAAGRRDGRPNGGHRARHHRAGGARARAAARARGRAGGAPRQRGRARPRPAAGRHQRAARAVAEQRRCAAGGGRAAGGAHRRRLRAGRRRPGWAPAARRADARTPDGRRRLLELGGDPQVAQRAARRAAGLPAGHGAGATRDACSGAARRWSRSWPVGARSGCSRSAGATRDAGPRATSGASSRRSHSGSRSPSRARCSTASARTSPRRCRPASCPRRSRRSRGSRWPRSTWPPAAGWTSAATSTTSSPSTTARGSSSSATCSARAPRRPR